ncbi:hypothetical protein SCLARK_00384 [Spiroplasma clarkii]|nr:hypothetical protein [Spiroplasma clarkii]ARU91119.1 hypothetical protein SCLARK_00384 [Spiroplasma clarkii]
MALDLGFDGWFYNDETNGGWPNGTVVPANYAYDLLKDFQAKKAKHQNPLAKNLKIIYYRDGGSLASINNTPNFTDYARMLDYVDILQNDFRVTPDMNKDYIASRNIDASKVHSLLETAAAYQYIGSYDWRQMVYGLDHTGEFEYDKNVYQSFSSFSGEGSGNFGSQAFQIANINGDLNEYDYRLKSWLFAQQVTNMYDNYMFTGLNGGLSESDTGSKSTSGINTRNMLYADPRIETPNSPLEPGSITYRDLFDYEVNAGLISKSYGIGSLIQEYTPITDEEIDGVANTPLIESSFSLGNGTKFLTRDKLGNVLQTVSDYPWTNRRLTSTLPTYTWDIKKTGENKVLPIDAKVNGFYDYYHPYQKGNSLAIGGKVLPDGSVTNAEFAPNSNYDWNIMGANISKSGYETSFVFSAFDETTGEVVEDVANSVQVLATYTNDGENKIAEVLGTPQKLAAGWYKIEVPISASTSKKLAKLGLRFNSKVNGNFKFNVGHFTFKKSSQTSNTELPEISNITSELSVIRSKNNVNVRLAWTSNAVDIDYYEIYYHYDNKYYRVNETSNTEVFVAELPIRGNKMQFGVIPVSKNGNQGEMKLINLDYSNYSNLIT